MSGERPGHQYMCKERCHEVGASHKIAFSKSKPETCCHLEQIEMKEILPPTLEGLAPVTRNVPEHHLKQGLHRETGACFNCFLPFVLITCEYDFSTEVPRTALVTGRRRAA